MRALRAMLVFTPPGCTVVHETFEPSISNSMRSESVKPRTANLAALYALCDGTLIKPKTLETFTMWPSSACFRYGKNALVP